MIFQNDADYIENPLFFIRMSKSRTRFKTVCVRFYAFWSEVGTPPNAPKKSHF